MDMGLAKSSSRGARLNQIINTEWINIMKTKFYSILTAILIVLTPVACQSSTTAAPIPTSLSTLPTDSPAPPTLAVTATPAFDLQKLDGIWVVENKVYERHSSNGNYTVVDNSIAPFIGRDLEGTIVVEGDTIKEYGERGCAPTDIGVYRIKFSEKGDSYSLSLLDDPCEWRKGGDVPAANTYRKLEPRVLPGIYTSEVTQAKAESAGGGDLLKFTGIWELQLNENGRFALLQNEQPITEGDYLSAGLQFALTAGNLCADAPTAAYKALASDTDVTFYKDTTLTKEYACTPMVLILTGHPWMKQ